MEIDLTKLNQLNIKLETLNNTEGFDKASFTKGFFAGYDACIHSKYNGNKSGNLFCLQVLNDMQGRVWLCPKRIQAMEAWFMEEYVIGYPTIMEEN